MQPTSFMVVLNLVVPYGMKIGWDHGGCMVIKDVS